ncbi:hypothetical protein Cob_v004366 [Colletotrichum orbiculare MAFF 240422]|uniref:Cyanovirin-N domain-containing protein n=1 Tax=Colletotrichum orbiculare (strain 104-T / ATCC 96160 / CBS 514.97 / LARS 414 / MAFF 240422) TaxID=1213857 RepID=N4VUN1_COLOR|nr:hypothetical protein Cob_v004366 [Colletotrichum orbiculare MAFF 240422]
MRTSVAAITALLATLAAGADCPAESSCIQTACHSFAVDKLSKGLEWMWYWPGPKLEAICVDRHGSEVYTWIDLRECVVNNNGEMFFQYQGGGHCQKCAIKDRDSNDAPVIMKCSCPYKDGKKWWDAEINLSQGIWHYDGVIGCYKTGGQKAPIAPVPLPKLKGRDDGDDETASSSRFKELLGAPLDPFRTRIGFPTPPGLRFPLGSPALVEDDFRRSSVQENEADDDVQADGNIRLRRSDDRNDVEANVQAGREVRFRRF